MNLHTDKDAFQVLLSNIHERTGYRLDVLEKDYYVVLILKELAQMQKDGLAAYFKGGTALYKALKTTNRFSEDIDLSVDTRDCSRTQNDKRLEKATKKYTSLVRNSEEGKTNRSEVVAMYLYDPIVPYDKDDALQRFGKLKVEATSFTISEPTAPMTIAALIYDLATDEEKSILESNYDVAPFEIQTITVERIFIDKLFAAEAYVRKSGEANRAFEAAKHIYDLTVMSEIASIISLCDNVILMQKLLKIRMDEEKERRDGIPGINPNQFSFFTEAKLNSAVRGAYEIMQKQYVLRECDRIPFEKAMDAIAQIKGMLENNPAWGSVDYQTGSV